MFYRRLNVDGLQWGTELMVKIALTATRRMIPTKQVKQANHSILPMDFHVI
jgi:hypothetical protein